MKTLLLVVSLVFINACGQAPKEPWPSKEAVDAKCSALEKSELAGSVVPIVEFAQGNVAYKFPTGTVVFSIVNDNCSMVVL